MSVWIGQWLSPPAKAQEKLQREAQHVAARHRPDRRPHGHDVVVDETVVTVSEVDVSVRVLVATVLVDSAVLVMTDVDVKVLTVEVSVTVSTVLVEGNTWIPLLIQASLHHVNPTAIAQEIWIYHQCSWLPSQVSF